MTNNDLSKKRILWIEDESERLEGMAQVLRSAGAEVVFAKTLSDALKSVEKNIFDLIIIDCMMPIGNDCGIDAPPREAGVYFLKTLKDKNIIKAPILVLSAIVDSILVSKFRALGVSSILQKPITQKQLVDNLLKTISSLDRD